MAGRSGRGLVGEMGLASAGARACGSGLGRLPAAARGCRRGQLGSDPRAHARSSGGRGGQLGRTTGSGDALGVVSSKRSMGRGRRRLPCMKMKNMRTNSYVHGFAKKKDTML